MKLKLFSIRLLRWNQTVGLLLLTSFSFINLPNLQLILIGESFAEQMR